MRKLFRPGEKKIRGEGIRGDKRGYERKGKRGQDKER
jgi:hypothetical protein